MKHHTQVRNAALFILVLTSSMLLSVTAQSQSTSLRLEGTKWKAVTELTLKSGDDLRMDGDYTFAEKGEVGAAYERDLYGMRRRAPRYDPSTNRYEEYYAYALISSLPVYEIGTYKLNGSSIHLEFSHHYIEATIKGNRMEGFITLKPNQETKRWVAERVSRTDNTPSISRNKKTEARDIKDSLDTESKLTSSSVKLNLGTYIGDASQATTAARDGFTVTDLLQISIKVESVDIEGAVKAVIVIGNNRGSVSGRINAEGKLQLEGPLVNPFLGGSRQFYLTATARGNSLTAGKYTSTSAGVRSIGEFNKAELEK